MRCQPGPTQSDTVGMCPLAGSSEREKESERDMRIEYGRPRCHIQLKRVYIVILQSLVTSVITRLHSVHEHTVHLKTVTLSLHAVDSVNGGHYNNARSDRLWVPSYVYVRR